LPIRFKLGDQIVMAAQAVDAMVVASLRRRGAFLKIAQQTYQHMDSAGVAFTYVFPSAAAAAGFIKKLNYQTIGCVPRYVKILNTAGATQVAGKRGLAGWLYRLWLIAAQLLRPDRSTKPPPMLYLSTITAFDDRFDDLWQRASVDFGVATIRDSVYLNWRYAANPLRQYHILIVEREAQLLGCLVLSASAETQTAAVLEWLVEPGESAAGLALLAEATRWAKQQHLSQMQCWLLPGHSSYQQLLTQSGFSYGSSKVLPGVFRYYTHFIVRSLPGALQLPDPQDLRNWYVSMGDHDYY
jgi:hypothetical protein